MSGKQDSEPLPDEYEKEGEKSAADDFAFDRGRELFGAPSLAPSFYCHPPHPPNVPPSFYHCTQASKDILAQDVVWDRSGQPRCPECNALLERQSD